MSKLAHSNDGTMRKIEAEHRIEEDLPTALTVIKAIALADGILLGGEGYLTKYQMIQLCKAWLDRKRGLGPYTETPEHKRFMEQLRRG